MFPEWEGNLLIGSLSGALVRLVIEGDRVVGEERLLTDVGRIRDVEVAADGSLMILIDDAEGQVMRVTRD
jgi:glucose/arabinose dehydrogenase